VSLSDVAAWDNLAAAFWRAARGKRHRPEVRRYAADLDTNLASLRRRILAAELPEGAMEVFEIHDPKRRTIHAPCFPHRVLHHAFMHHLAPVIERSLVADTFACIPGRGTLAAVLRAQAHARRYPWYAKIDVAAYFASIDHMRLLADLHRRRYRRARARWEALYQRGTIDATALQRGYDSALAITAHADAVRFRRLELERRPPPEA
jgi:hypothetical protein